MYTYIKQLDHEVMQAWSQIKHSAFYASLDAGGISQDLYQDLLYELHYCVKDQVASTDVRPCQINTDDCSLLRLFYNLADYAGVEQTGHDLMNVQPLTESTFVERYPLPATMALKAYRHYVSINYQPIAKLAYSYVVLQSCAYMADIFDCLDAALNIKKPDLTFINELHKRVDLNSDAVRKALMVCRDNKLQQEQLVQIGQTSLFLIGALLNAISDKQSTGKTTLYDVLIAV